MELAHCYQLSTRVIQIVSDCCYKKCVFCKLIIVYYSF